LRRIAVTGLVAIATVLSTWAAIPAASAASAATAVGSGMSPDSATSAAAAGGLPGTAASGLPGSLPARHAVSYPPGVTPATTSPFDIISDVSCFHAGDCVAVGGNVTSNGSGNLPLAYLWNGTAWKQTSLHLPSGIKYADLNSVSCKPGGCLAVGRYQRGTKFYPLAEDWTGTRWTDPLPQVPSGALDATAEAVSCYSATFCVMTGSYTPASNTSHLLAFDEVWTGKSWRSSVPTAPSSPYVYRDLDAVSCSTAKFCLLAGAYATSDQGFFKSLVETFDGAHWKILTDAAPTPQQGHVDYVYGDSCTSATQCTAVGVVGAISGNSVTWHAFAEVLAGSTWQVTPTGSLASGAASSFEDVSCVSPAFCVAVGGLGPFNYWTTGRAVDGTFNGSTWAVHDMNPPSGSGSALFGVECLTTTNCIAGGTEGPYNKPSAHGLSAFYTGSVTWKQVNA
jgi:hypothetical protein